MKIERWSAGAVLLGLALVLLQGSNAVVAASLYTEGHADIGVSYDDGFDLHYRFGSDANPPLTSQAGNAPDVIVEVRDPSVPRPAGSQWDFLGTPAGEPLWFLPQGQEVGKPFLGFATEQLENGDWVGNIQIGLKSVVDSPAGSNFSIWQTNFFGSPVVQWETVNGLADDQFSLPIGAHSHYNWGFTKPGVYKFEIEFRGTHATDGLQVVSDVFSFNVGPLVPEPGTWVMAAVGLSSLTCVAIRRRIAKR